MRIARATGLAMQPGKMVIELRRAGADKGVAVERLMREPSLAGARPVFVGDDETDEAAFAAVTKLGGAGVLVGAASRPTRAHYQLEGVEATLRWLEASIDRTR